MGMGQIGDGVKRIRITQVETEKLEELNFTISLFIATMWGLRDLWSEIPIFLVLNGIL